MTYRVSYDLALQSDNLLSGNKKLTEFSSETAQLTELVTR